MGRLGILGLASKSLCDFRRVRHDFPSPLAISEYFSSLGDGYGLPHLRQSLFRSYSFYGCSFNVAQSASEFEAAEPPSMKRSFHATSSCDSAKRDFYEILGVPKNASTYEIKKAFLALAKKCHPDTNNNNPTAKRKFQEIRDAYETLRDSEKKAKYDEESRGATGKAYATRETVEFTDAHKDQCSDTFRKESRGATRREYAIRETVEFTDEQFSETFRKIFHEVNLTLSFGEAAKGCKKHLSFDAARVPCNSCNGRGYPICAKPKKCPICKGGGTVTVSSYTSTCPNCKGFGGIIKERCKTCKGCGMVEGVKEVTVAIPAGVKSGDTFRVLKADNRGGRGVLLKVNIKLKL